MTKTAVAHRLPWRRSSGFLTAMLLPILIGLVTIPLLIGYLGPSVWSHLVVAQTIGSLGYLGVARGWFAAGPTRVAALDADGQAAVYRASIRDRAPSAVAFGVPVALVCVWVFDAPAAPTLVGLAQVVAGLGASWFFVGSRRPGLLLIFDTLPRMAGIVLGVALLGAGAGVELYALSVLLGSCAAAVLPLALVGKGVLAPGGPSSRNLAFLTTVCSYLTTSIPLLAVAGLAASDRPVYAMVDRLLVIGLAVLASYTQAMQGWVPEQRGEVYARAFRGLRWAAMLALVAFLLAWLGMPVAADVLSGGTLDVRIAVSAGLGLVALFVTLSQYVGLVVLAGSGGWQWIAASAVTGVAVGLPLIVALTVFHGGVGAAFGCAVAELVVLAIQVSALSVDRRGRTIHVRPFPLGSRAQSAPRPE